MGIEPTRPQWPRDFKSLVSTNSTISANGASCGSGSTRTTSPVKERIYSPCGYQLPVTLPNFEPPVGFEPTACSLQVSCTTTVLRRQINTTRQISHQYLAGFLCSPTSHGQSNNRSSRSLYPDRAPFGITLFHASFAGPMTYRCV